MNESLDMADRDGGFWFLIAVNVLLALAMLLWGLQVFGAEADGSWRVTAYCPCKKCCGPDARGLTKSETRADHPLVAGPPEMAFGTRLRIPGYAGGRWVRCEDRGGAIQGRRLDVLFPTHAEAQGWGVRWVKVEEAKP